MKTLLALLLVVQVITMTMLWDSLYNQTEAVDTGECDYVEMEA